MNGNDKILTQSPNACGFCICKNQNKMNFSQSHNILCIPTSMQQNLTQDSIFIYVYIIYFF